MSRTEAEKAGQADHSLSDINPGVGVFISVPSSLDTYLILQTVGEKQTETKPHYHHSGCTETV